MVISIVIGTIVGIIVLMIYVEYRNEKQYQEERLQRRKRREKKLTPETDKRSAGTSAVEPATPKPKHLQKPVTSSPAVNTKTPVSGNKVVSSNLQQTLKENQIKTKLPADKKPDIKIQKQVVKKRTAPKTDEKSAVELSQREYPDFSYKRLLEMGLSEEDAYAFIQELIPQIGEQIPLLDEALGIPNFHKMEQLIHSIKGASTNIGTGGISDLLVDYHTYLQTGKEVPVIEAYQAHLKHYFKKLKKQFPPKN